MQKHLWKCVELLPLVILVAGPVKPGYFWNKWSEFLIVDFNFETKISNTNFLIGKFLNWRQSVSSFLRQFKFWYFSENLLLNILNMKIFYKFILTHLWQVIQLSCVDFKLWDLVSSQSRNDMCDDFPGVCDYLEITVRKSICLHM